jgi:hypothetical protein
MFTYFFLGNDHFPFPVMTKIIVATQLTAMISRSPAKAAATVITNADSTAQSLRFSGIFSHFIERFCVDKNNGLLILRVSSV